MIKLIILVIFFYILVFVVSWVISDYDKCYSEMEDLGIAVFGCCKGLTGGSKQTGYLQEMCVDCPYYTPVDYKKGEKKE